jgi:hypothetical protein
MADPGLPKVAFTGGLAIGGYLGHLPRRLNDIDLVVSPSDVSAWDSALGRRQFRLVGSERAHIVLEYASQNRFFDIDTHVGRIVLANPPSWEPLGEYDLSDALTARVFTSLATIAHDRRISIPVVPAAHHVLMKLLPPPEPTNLHDLVYLFLSQVWSSAEVDQTIQIASNCPLKLQSLFAHRTAFYVRHCPQSVWFDRLEAGAKAKVLGNLNSLLAALIGDPPSDSLMGQC